ncbi:MAG: hypothetical protein WBL44_05270 [Nitrososphaeraceae archaeon]|jgi:hypothetical protein
MTNKKKPPIYHIDNAGTQNGKWKITHKQAVEAADRIFNKPLKEKPNVTRPRRRKK